MDVQKHYLLITEINLESHIFSLRNRYLLKSHRTLRYFKLLSSSLPNLLSYYLFPILQILYNTFLTNIFIILYYSTNNIYSKFNILIFLMIFFNYILIYKLKLWNIFVNNMKYTSYGYSNKYSL